MRDVPGNATFSLRRLTTCMVLRISKPRRNMIALAFCAMALTVSLGAGEPPVQSRVAAKNQPRSGSTAPALRESSPRLEPLHPAASIFTRNERLEYRVGWQSISPAASLSLEVRALPSFSGAASYHAQARVETVAPTSYVYSVKDQLDSFSQPPVLVTTQFEMRLQETRKQEHRSVLFLPEGEAATETGSAMVARGSALRVPRGTRDPLAALYALRLVDWSRTRDVRLRVSDGRKLYEIRAHLDEPNDRVRAPAGEFNARRISLRVFDQNREREDVLLHIWLADDAALTPVVIEAILSFGAVRAELTKR